MSECYRMIPPKYQEDFEALIENQTFEFDDDFKSHGSYENITWDSPFFGNDEAELELDGEQREGRFTIQGTRVEGKVWLDQNRPFKLFLDDESLR
mmetsp:Transcript_19415/g.30395  ORF Transcript_19415/g.30395 Transcript_19415/m.30395 type:complete len:95 (+) Transcript_19415:139-423(+)